MLPRMLLHLVVAPRPVDLPGHPVADPKRGDSGQPVQHHPLFDGDSCHGNAGQLAEIVQLPARSWIKAAAVQHNDGAGRQLAQVHDLCLELLSVGILKLQTYCHLVFSRAYQNLRSFLPGLQ